MHDKDVALCREVLERELGPDWENILKVAGTQDLRERCGKSLTSFMAFPERGNWGGNNKWRGNCSPLVVQQIAQYVLETKRYNRQPLQEFTLLDPMSGSGTSQSVADNLGIKSVLYDLNPRPAHGSGGWNALKDDVKDSADLIFLHPPYHNIIRYSGDMWGKAHADDLSRCENWNDFIEKLNFVLRKLFLSLRKDGRLAVLVGDVRQNGKLFSMQNDMMKIGSLEANIVKGQFNCVSDSRTYSKPFIPIVTEYLLLFKKDEVFVVPFSLVRSGSFDVSKTDSPALTWNALIRMTMESVGGKAKLSKLYELLRDHPKAKSNAHYSERVRATVYEHPSDYVNCGNGEYALSYMAA